MKLFALTLASFSLLVGVDTASRPAPWLAIG